MSAILPPAERLWWKHPLDRVEGTWIAIAFVWCMVMFFMMVGWHIWGKQNLSTETYRTKPEMFAAKAQAMVDKYQVRTETAQNIPVVAPPAGSDVFLIDAPSGSARTYAECFERVGAWVQCGRRPGGARPRPPAARQIPRRPLARLGHGDSDRARARAGFDTHGVARGARSGRGGDDPAWVSDAGGRCYRTPLSSRATATTSPVR